MARKKTLRILFTFTPAFNPNAGGVQRTTYKLGKHFFEHGLEVNYYSLAKDGHESSAAGKLFSAPCYNGLKNQRNIDNLKMVLRDIRPQVVINQMPYEHRLRSTLFQEKRNISYLLIGCLRNSLFNFKNNVGDRIDQMLPRPVNWAMNNVIGRAIVSSWHWLKHRRDLKCIIDQHDYFILLAPPNRKELEHFVGHYKPEKIKAIPNSIPRVLEEIPEKEKIILHVGRINVQQKRSDLLLDFWERIHVQLPDWKFIIVGDGDYFETLQKDLQMRNLPRVELKGRQQPESYYKKAAIFMMPSAYEGFPNTLLEAQSYGCASLAFRSYGALDWIGHDGKDVKLFPPFQVDQMALFALGLTRNPEKLKNYQAAALQNASRFIIDKVGKLWLEFFNSRFTE